MKRALSLLASIALTGVIITGNLSCDKVEGTGRGTFYLLSAEEENKLGEDTYKDILSKEKISKDPAAIALVERVGRHLAAAAPDKGFKYEFTVLESDTVNAFCLPGGKVCVYTGILPYCQNEAGLATVLGHEIAHAIARHGGERMSKGMIVEGVGAGIDALLQDRGVSATTRNVTLAAYGAGTNVGIMLPYSRAHESEADYLGLTYMAKSGYDPNEAPKFWDRFKAFGSSMPAFLSTHPASDDRARDLKARLPEAQRLYDAAPNKYGAGEAVPERYRKDLPAATATATATEAPTNEEPPQERKKKKKKKK